MQTTVNNGELTTVFETAEFNVEVGESARIDVNEAVNYIKTGQAEVQQVVDAGTATFNANASAKTEAFNNNATAKTNAFNSNATSKTNTFNDNASSKTTAFNENATSKTTDFNSNASSKTGDFNTNATSKTTAFNDNATSKTNTFNQNATDKTTAFNSNATEKTTAFNDNYTAKKALIDAEVQTAKDWATKTDGKVDGVDYSAKYYAQSILPIASDITTVAGIASDVTTVSSISSDVTSVASNNTDISTVADNISDVNSVATDILKVTAVADDLTNIDAVNANKTNIDTVASISSDVTTVSDISSDVTSVASNNTDISAVADDLTNINSVAGDLTNIGNVASDLTNIDSVAGNIANVNAVAGNATNINAVNSNKTNIDAVAGNASNINTVAGIAGDVYTVSSIASDVTAVKNNASNINAVAGDLTNINAVAGDLTNIDNASTYADNANIWAEGTDAQVQALGGVHSSKGWADQSAQGQVQSNWAETDTSAKSYIQNKPTLGTMAAESASDYTKTSGLATVATSGSYNDLSNKPTIPTVNNATLTIQKNSTDVATFTANASSNVTANISVPTNVSDLNNDSGFISGITSSDVTSALGYTPVNPTSLATVATSGSYNDLSNKPTVDQTYDGTSTNAQSGVAVASAISGKANDSDVVKLTGNQTLGTGVKGFTDIVEFKNGGRVYSTANNTERDSRYCCKFYQYGLADSTLPSNVVFGGFHCFDKNNFEYGTAYSYIDTSGTVGTCLWVHTPNGTATNFGIYQNASGVTWTSAPTPATSDNSTKIATTAYVKSNLSSKQDTLVSGTNIKTINGNSVLGSGDLTVGASWGSITGTLSNQTDLSNALSGKADVDLSNMNPTQTVKNTIVGWGMPDYSAGVVISSGHIAVTDGVIVDSGYVVHNTGLIKINNLEVYKLISGGAYFGYSVYYAVQKGDVVTFSGITSEYFGGMRFYPLKGVN